MKKLVFALLAVAAGFALASPAQAGQCGLPGTRPLWIDFAPSSNSPELVSIFRRPGVIVAGSQSRPEPDYLAYMRAGGARTIYWDMYLNKRTGTPNDPADPAVVVEKANRLFDFAAVTSGCAKPLIVENELNGAGTTTPWSPNNAQYRANVLLFLQTLAARGARPILLVSSPPYTGGLAGDWWRRVARVADIVRQTYFNGATLHAQGPVLASRTLRTSMRTAVRHFTRIGIPPSRVGLMLGFQTTAGLGYGGREGLRPASAWFEIVKLHALAAREVARETKIGTVWSWGWGTWSAQEDDRDKPAAACVWLWARNPRLGNGRSMAGPGFNASRTEGQLILPRGTQCIVNGERVSARELGRLTKVTGDRELALTALFSRAIQRSHASVSNGRILSTERGVIAARFHGSRAAYLRALARAGASAPTARGVIGDALRRAHITARLPVRRPSADEISAFYASYGSAMARVVEVTPAAPWLGGKRRGVALAGAAPRQLFRLPAGRRATIRTLDGTYRVRALGMPLPLAALPLGAARPAITAQLVSFARGHAFVDWLAEQQRGALRGALCRRDRLPALGNVDLSAYLPFLSLPA